MSRRASVVFLLSIWSSVVTCDFPCLCCYSLETAVYKSKALTAGTVRYMYEFDCKPLYDNLTTTDNSWTAIQFEHKIGFVQMTQDQVIQQCPGSIPTGDQVTEMTSAATSTTHLPPTLLPASQPSATQPPQTQSPTSQSQPTQPSSIQPPQTQSPTTQPQPPQPPSTQPPQTTQSLTTQQPLAQTLTMQSNKTHPTTHHSNTAHTQTTQATPTHLTSRPATQSPTQASITQSTTVLQQMTSQPPLSTTTLSTTTTISLKTTQQTTIQTTQPTTHPTLTTIRTQPSFTTSHDANTHILSTTNAPANSCPNDVVTHASKNQGYVMSHGGSCFELVLHALDWNDAEHRCQDRGGHLTSIKNQAEENALLVFMYDHEVKHNVWIGLSDQHHEQRFTWSSGLPLYWTNWIPGNQNPFFFNEDDCVALVSDTSMVSAAHSNSLGTWDDQPCIFKKPFICRFDANPSGPIIG